MGIFRPSLLVIFSLFVVCSNAYTFYVGGRDGWVLHPSESYSDWAGRNRFQVNDTLVFKYKKGEDSVLVVSEPDFDQCNLTDPIQKMDAGDSVFKFDHSGPFYFVSGTGDRCKQGQKLIIVVLAVRPKSPPGISPALAPTLSPSGSPALAPTISPVVSPALAPTLSPGVSPALAPTLSPGPNSPLAQPPTTSPVSSPITSPIMSPTGSPAPTPFSITPPMNSPVASPPGVSPAPSPFTVSSPPVSSPALSPSTQPSAPGTPPSPPGTPVTATPPGTPPGTPNNPTGSSSPGSSDSRVSSVMLAAAVIIVNYGIFN